MKGMYLNFICKITKFRVKLKKEREREQFIFPKVKILQEVEYENR